MNKMIISLMFFVSSQAFALDFGNYTCEYTHEDMKGVEEFMADLQKDKLVLVEDEKETEINFTSLSVKTISSSIFVIDENDEFEVLCTKDTPLFSPKLETEGFKI